MDLIGEYAKEGKRKPFLDSFRDTELSRMNEINIEIKNLGYENYGYGAPAPFSGGIGYYFVSPYGEGMPSKKGAKYTDNNKWIGAKIPEDVRKLIEEYASIMRL